MMKFRISYQHKGKTKNRYFSTLKTAVKVCSKIFQATGIVLGIEEVEKQESKS